MPLTSWSASDPVAVTKMNAMVNDLPKVMLHCWMGGNEIDLVNTVGAVTTSYPTVPQLVARCHPLVGDYVRTLLEMRTDNASKTIDVSVRVWRAGVEDQIFTASVTGSTAQVVSSVNGITALATLGNMSCEDAQVRFYFKSPAPAGVLFFVKNVMVESGMAASLSNYLE